MRPVFSTEFWKPFIAKKNTMAQLSYRHFCSSVKPTLRNIVKGCVCVWARNLTQESVMANSYGANMYARFQVGGLLNCRNKDVKSVKNFTTQKGISKLNISPFDDSLVCWSALIDEIG